MKFHIRKILEFPEFQGKCSFLFDRKTFCGGQSQQTEMIHFILYKNGNYFHPYYVVMCSGLESEFCAYTESLLHII